MPTVLPAHLPGPSAKMAATARPMSDTAIQGSLAEPVLPAMPRRPFAVRASIFSSKFSKYIEHMTVVAAYGIVACR